MIDEEVLYYPNLLVIYEYTLSWDAMGLVLKSCGRIGSRVVFDGFFQRFEEALSNAGGRIGKDCL